jgi:hypothetical protein
VQHERGRRRRDRETIGRRSRCGKSRAGDRTSRPPPKQSTASPIRSRNPILATCQPSGFVPRWPVCGSRAKNNAPAALPRGGADLSTVTDQPGLRCGRRHRFNFNT